MTLFLFYASLLDHSLKRASFVWELAAYICNSNTSWVEARVPCFSAKQIQATKKDPTSENMRNSNLLVLSFACLGK